MAIATETKHSVRGNQGVKVVKSCTIARKAEELYNFWRKLENMPRFTKHLISVRQISERESHWVARAPGGPAEWTAEIINEHPNQLIAWRSIQGSEIDNAGSVRFDPTPDGQSTEVTVSLEYRPPVGRVGLLVARLYGEDPERQVEEDLQQFKALMETGEVPTIEGQLQGPNPSPSR